MSSATHLLLTGTYIQNGKQPDGDSVRFAADHPALYPDIHNGHRVDISKQDITAPLHLESVDALDLALSDDRSAAGRGTAGRAAHNIRLHELHGGRARDRHRKAAQGGLVSTSAHSPHALPAGSNRERRLITLAGQ